MAMTLQRVGLGDGEQVVEFRCSNGTVIPVPKHCRGMVSSLYDPQNRVMWVPYHLPNSASNQTVDNGQLTPPGSQAGNDREVEWPCCLCLEQGLTDATGLEQFSEIGQMVAHANKHRDLQDTQKAPIQDLLVSCFPAAKVYDLQEPSTEEAGGEEPELENVVQNAIDEQLPTPPKSEAKKRKAKDRESTGDEADAPLQKKTKKHLSKEAGNSLEDGSAKGGGKEAKPTKELGEVEKALVEQGWKKFILRVENFYVSNMKIKCGRKKCPSKGTRPWKKEALMLHVLNHANAFQFQCTGANCVYQACRRTVVTRHIDAAHGSEETRIPRAAKVIRPELREEGLLQVLADCFPKTAKHQ